MQKGLGNLLSSTGDTKNDYLIRLKPQPIIELLDTIGNILGGISGVGDVASDIRDDVISRIENDSSGKGNTESKKKKEETKVKKPSSSGSMQNKVKKGQAPKEIDRVDPPT